MSGATFERRRVLALAGEYLAAHPGLFELLITHVLPLTDAQRAFELADTGAQGRLKVVLQRG
jgi:L-iditol 2-dehydrogenase